MSSETVHSETVHSETVHSETGFTQKRSSQKRISETMIAENGGHELRSSEVSPLIWRGVGATAFYGSLRGVDDQAPLCLTAEAAIPTWLGRFPGVSGPFVDRALERYFAAGGREAWVAVTGRDESALPPNPGRVFQDRSLGDNTSASSLSGLYALAETEAVGVLALETPPRALRQELLSLAEQRRDLLFVLERRDASKTRKTVEALGAAAGGLDGVEALGLTFLAPNIVEATDAAVLCAWLERLDFRPGARPMPPEPAANADYLMRLQAWRRCEGLRRSIDWGTRWLLFELHHSRIWRRAEREVYGFLYSLGRAGLVDPLARIDVRCTPSRLGATSGDGVARRTSVVGSEGLGRVEEESVRGDGDRGDGGRGDGGPPADHRTSGPAELAPGEEVPSVCIEVGVALRQPYEDARRRWAAEVAQRCVTRDQWPDDRTGGGGAGVSDTNQHEVVE